MNSQTAFHAQEFDEMVEKYNEWLTSLEKPKVQKRNYWADFLRGLSSVGGIFPVDQETFQYTHPLYSRTDITPEQKDAIALASDLKRMDKTLDTVITSNSATEKFSVEEAKIGKDIAQGMYEHFRNIYVSYALNRKE